MHPPGSNSSSALRITHVMRRPATKIRRYLCLVRRLFSGKSFVRSSRESLQPWDSSLVMWVRSTWSRHQISHRFQKTTLVDYSQRIIF